MKLALLALLSAALLTAFTPAGSPVVHAADTHAGVTLTARAEPQPNIVLFMTDDQNRNEMRWMPKTRTLLGGHGVTFSRAMSPAPLCCPARAMTLTGQYGQNNGVQHNQGPFGAYHSLVSKDHTLATWLQAAGYRTALVGKFLNGYGGRTPPPVTGWTRWNPSVRGIYNYFGTTFLTRDGTRTYQRNVTPVIADHTERIVRAFSAAGAPFFLWISQLPPHGQKVIDRQGRSTFTHPAPSREHARVLGRVTAPSMRKPSFNVAGSRPLPYPGEPKKTLTWVQGEFTGRIRTLQDADDALARLVAVLRDTGELRDTYIIFVSDNGMLLGEHRLLGKNYLYHEDLRVPLIVRVPGATRATTSTTPVTTVDLAPTIAALAGAVPDRVIDGASFVPVLRGEPVAWRDTQLIQTGSTRTRGAEPGWDLRGVYTRRFTYMRRSRNGAEFLYDRKVDPFELANRVASARYHAVLVALRARLQVLADCAGDSCNQDFGPLPEVG